MHRQIGSFLLIGSLALVALAQSAAARDIDPAYTAEHGAWTTTCAVRYGRNNETSCHILRLDEASGLAMRFTVKGFFDEPWGELFLIPPPGAPPELLPGPVTIEAFGEANELKTSVYSFMGEGDEDWTVSIFVPVNSTYVQKLATQASEITFTVPRVDDETLVVTFDMEGASDAWDALKDYHDWK